jgi:ribokinase
VKIVTIGAAVQDIFLSNSSEFRPVCESPETCFLRLELGAKADVNQIHFSTGGGATNAAVTFARQGIETAFMGSVGNDPAGQAVLADLDAEGVDTSHVRISERYNTGYSVLLLAPNGERTILTYRGASTHYYIRDFDFSSVEADWLYISNLSGKMDVLNHIVTEAKKRGIQIMYNPGKKELEQREKLIGILEDIDVLLVNKEEMQILVEGEELEELILRGLNYAPVVLITDSTNGVIASDGKTIVRAGLYDDRPSKDRTGAGDAFGSGFLSRWIFDQSLKDSILLASANSSSVVTQVGTKAALLHKGAKLHAMPISERKI